jgi:hypothetical protein
VLAVITKPDDDVVRRFLRDGSYRRVKSWPPPVSAGAVNRVALWPDTRRREVIDRLPAIVSPALRGAYEQGGWAVYVDELNYVVRTLRLQADLVPIWSQGRSMGVTMIAGSQRPAWVPLEAYSQATHLFLWATSDRRDLNRLSDIAARADVGLVRRVLPVLDQHEVLYVNAGEGSLRLLGRPGKV